VFNFTARTLEAIEAVGGMDQVDVPPGLLTRHAPSKPSCVKVAGGHMSIYLSHIYTSHVYQYTIIQSKHLF
jgi:hypothetical protein